MKAIKISTANIISLIDVPENGEPLYKQIQAAIEGYSEYTYPARLPKGYVMIINDEAKLIGLPLNLIASFLYASELHGDPIVGNAFIVKLGTFCGESDVVGIPDDEANDLMNKLTRIVLNLKGD